MYDNTLSSSNPAYTFSLDDFIALRLTDDSTYFNFSIVEKQGNIIFTDHSLIDDYLSELTALCYPVQLTDEELKKYRYSPDLLAYDIYGSTQLDFIILKANDMIDPKEFNIKTIKLPYNSYLKSLLSDIVSANKGYIEQNRIDNGMDV